MVKFEDSPPCVPARAPRQSTIRSKVHGRYLVSWGAGSEREFPTFVEALACLIDHQSDKFGVQIHNLDRMTDGVDSGLSEIELLAIEAAEEAFTVEFSS